MNLKDITKSRILVTGGMGYVGSFTCKKFLKKYKTKLISIDNLSRSNKYSQKFCNNYKCDVANEKKIQKILLENKISTIIDLASYTCVRESIKRPYYYKNNNLLKQIKLIKTAKQCGVKKFIFSSSLSIYEKNKVKKNLSPYSKYKLEIENFLKKESNKNFKVIIIRYPNISGADNSGSLGDRNHKITRIFKIIFNKVLNNKTLTLFLNLKSKKFPIRSYAHVEDIAELNLKLIDNKINLQGNNFKIFNISTNINVSNYEILSKMQKLMKKKVKLKFKQADKRENFLPLSDGDNKIKRIRITSKQSTLDNILKTNIRWFQYIKNEL